MNPNSKNDNPVVGLTTYANGEKDVFTNADRFIKAIAEELPERSSSGFAFRVMNADPATRKAIDDLVYNEYGERNPHDLDYYEKNERRDADYEVVLTRHGYTVMGWDRYRKDWSNVVYCPTPTALRDALLDSYASFAEIKVVDGERDLTKKEQAQIKAECQKLRRKCKEAEKK